MWSRLVGSKYRAPLFAAIVSCVALMSWLSCTFSDSLAHTVVVSAGHHPVELWPIWRDAYKPLDRIPPWPRGATERQMRIIRSIDRMWIAALDPNPMSPDEKTSHPSFHGQRVVAFSEVTNIRKRATFQAVLLEASNYSGEIGSWVSEGYPGLAVRLQSGEEFLDCVIVLRHRVIFLQDSSDMTFVMLPKDSSGKEVLRGLSRGLPINPMAD